jgi:DNA-binding transcriptional LysR family regulator
MRSLNLDQLRTFMEVIRLGSFTAAGRSLNLTQPAISQQIKELEGRLGVQLIARLGKRAFATEAGKELSERGTRLLTESEETVNAIQRYRDGWLAPVRLGTTITVCVYLLPKLLGELRETHPELDVSIEVDLSHVVVEKVARNELDFGLVALPIDKSAPIEVTRIREDPMMAVFPARERNIPEVVTAAYLRTRPLLFDLPTTQLYRVIVEWFKGEGVEPKPILHLGNSEALKAMVAAGVGIAILAIENADDPFLGRSLLARPLSPPLKRELGLVAHRNKPFHPAMPLIRDRLMKLRN